MENKFRILIMEDYDGFSLLYKILLNEKLKCDVDFVKDDKSTLEKVKSSKYHLCIINLDTPGISGYEICKEIRTFNKYIPVIAASVYPEIDCRDKASKSGFNDFFNKDFTSMDLFKVISKELNN